MFASIKIFMDGIFIVPRRIVIFNRVIKPWLVPGIHLMQSLLILLIPVFWSLSINHNSDTGNANDV